MIRVYSVQYAVRIEFWDDMIGRREKRTKLSYDVIGMYDKNLWTNVHISCDHAWRATVSHMPSLSTV